MLQGYKGFTTVLIMQYRVTVKKSTPLTVLPGNTNRESIMQQAGMCQRLGKTPVDRQCTGRHLAPVIDHLHDTRMQLKARWQLLQASSK